MSISLKEKQKQLKYYLRWQRNKGALSEIASHLSTIFFNLLAKVVARKSLAKPQQTDILFLYRSPSGLKHTPLVNALRASGLTVMETAIPKDKTIFKQRLLLTSTKSNSFAFIFEKLFCNYIINQYQPKIIINDKHGSTLSPFLRHFMNQKKGFLIQLSHSIPTYNYRRFGMIDFDYYFIYGQSSQQHLEQFPKRFGNTQLVLSGSLQIEERLNNNEKFNQQSLPNSNFIIILGSGPSLEDNSEDVRLCYQFCLEAAKSLKLLCLFKPHPRSNLNLWNELSVSYENHRIIEHLNSGVSNALVAVSCYTNAVIDCALLGIPAITFDTQKTIDHFHVSKFYLPFCASQTELMAALETMHSNRQEYRKKAQAFGQFHIANHGNVVERIAKDIEHILSNDKKIDSTALNSKL